MSEEPRSESSAAEPRHPSEVEVRWRQARNPPPPVVRAVLANVAIAPGGGLPLLLSAWPASRAFSPRAQARSVAEGGAAIAACFRDAEGGHGDE